MNVLSTISVLALSLFLWSCDNLGAGTRPSGLNPRDTPVYSTASGKKYEVVRESESAGFVSATVGPAGGQLILGKHRLVIPANAVNAPTVFTMSRVDGEAVRMRFSASRDTHNDVGSKGFPVPLQLRLHFGDAPDALENSALLEVVYFRPDGLIDPQPSVVNTQGKVVEGSISHFSDFGLAFPH